MKRMRITCDSCGAVKDQDVCGEILVIANLVGTPQDGRTFDVCEDCLVKISGHRPSDHRCPKSIKHQAEQAVLAMLKSEVKKFDRAEEDTEGGGK